MLSSVTCPDLCSVRYKHVEVPSKREVVRSLLRSDDNETIDEDIERDYNKLSQNPKGN